MNIHDRYAKDIKCRYCNGTGMRKRGYCSKCSGTGTAGLEHPRLRYNWGFHDGARDFSNNRMRDIITTGKQTLSCVSREFDWWYAAGYEHGILTAKSGEYDNCSSKSWKSLDLPERF